MSERQSRFDRDDKVVVMKFGGTSVEDAAAIRRVIDIVQSRGDVQPVVVVSALIVPSVGAKLAGAVDVIHLDQFTRHVVRGIFRRKNAGLNEVRRRLLVRFVGNGGGTRRQQEQQRGEHLPGAAVQRWFSPHLGH